MSKEEYIETIMKLLYKASLKQLERLYYFIKEYLD